MRLKTGMSSARPFRSIVILVALLSAALGGQDQDEIGTELNRMRADPPGYAKLLEVRRKYYDGKVLRLPGQIGIMTSEGASALNEAVAALRATAPLPPLTGSEALHKAAEKHARDIGSKGIVGHEGSDGSTPRKRMERYAGALTTTAEVIAFGAEGPRAAVMDLLIDDGLPGRGHRKILLDKTLRAFGAACAPHATYRTVCVIDLADPLTAKR